MDIKELIAAAQSCEVNIIEIINEDAESDAEFKELAIEDIQHISTLFRTFLLEMEKAGDPIESLWFKASKLTYDYIDNETVYELGEDAEAETVEDIKTFRFQVLEFYAGFFDEFTDLTNEVE
ncbi:hypothetical protein [[Acholeplasma] multilocale]|uniref:hypothetical protein n=1 Tax=[Acholeplasma] multilocale TaxID=264638 RepID=UPI00047E96DA|nr:hypothetical protein [[Acholeplasma] multilocale]